LGNYYVEKGEPQKGEESIRIRRAMNIYKEMGIVQIWQFYITTKPLPLAIRNNMILNQISLRYISRCLIFSIKS